MRLRRHIPPLIVVLTALFLSTLPARAQDEETVYVPMIRTGATVQQPEPRDPEEPVDVRAEDGYLYAVTASGEQFRLDPLKDTLGLNDPITDEELPTEDLGPGSEGFEATIRSAPASPVSRDDLPDRVDLSQWQTEIRSQGGRGTCVSFALTAALEAYYKHQGYGDLNLSEQFLHHTAKMTGLNKTLRSDASIHENGLGMRGGFSVAGMFNRLRTYRIPLESKHPNPVGNDSPYISRKNYERPNQDGDVPRIDPGDASVSQQVYNNFNLHDTPRDYNLPGPLTFAPFPREALQNGYYGITSYEMVPDDRRHDPTWYEEKLNQGHEIAFAIRTCGDPNPGNGLWEPGGVAGGAENGDGLGTALAGGDFNGDGYADLAIGVPDESIGNIQNAGAVNVIYGSDQKLTAADNTIWHQDSNGMDGAVEQNDRFGSALAAGDFDGDGYTDLAVGIPGEDVNGNSNAGAVQILYGTGAGIDASRNQLWHQGTGNVAGALEANDGFGAALAAGDFNGDGYDDLAIGVPAEDGGGNDTGAVNVLYGRGSIGLTDGGNQIWDQNSGLPGGNEAGDRFGAALTTGDFDGDGYDDLAVGVPGEAIDGADDAGAVNVIFGSARLLADAGSQMWHQNSGSVEGAVESGDGFGSALASADFNQDGYADLAIGVPGEDVGSIQNAGAVNVLYGSGSGPSDSYDQIWDQDSSVPNGSIQEDAEEGDRFGAALAASGSFLAVGVPGETLDDESAAGAVNVIYATPGADLSAVHNQVWSQSHGLSGGAEENDDLGAALTVGDFDGDGAADLVIGVPGEGLGNKGNAGSTKVIYGGSPILQSSVQQVWNQADCGGHAMLMIGYDRTDPDLRNHYFIVKNSWGGSDYVKLSYEYLTGDASGRLTEAGYITGVTDPKSTAFRSQLYVGRWKMEYDGINGLLDITRLSQTYADGALDGHDDYRLGTFYTAEGDAYRVNGTVGGNRIDFYIDLHDPVGKPNLEYDELQGTHFIGTMDQDEPLLMGGTYQDADGNTRPFYASKEDYYTGTPGDDSYSYLSWMGLWDVYNADLQGVIDLGVTDTENGTVSGTYTDTNGTAYPVSGSLTFGSYRLDLSIDSASGSHSFTGYMHQYDQSVISGDLFRNDFFSPLVLVRQSHFPPPEITITEPENGAYLIEGNVDLRATVRDQGEYVDNPSVIWTEGASYEDGGRIIGNGAESVTKLGPGDYTLYATYTGGEETAVAQVDVTVVAQPDGSASATITDPEDGAYFQEDGSSPPRVEVDFVGQGTNANGDPLPGEMLHWGHREDGETGSYTPAGDGVERTIALWGGNCTPTTHEIRLLVIDEEGNTAIDTITVTVWAGIACRSGSDGAAPADADLYLPDLKND